MSKVFSEIQTGTRVYLDESNQTDFLDTEVKRSINYAYHDLISHIVEVYEEFYTTVAPLTITTVANQQEYTLSSTLIKIGRVEINYKPSDSTSQAVRALPIKLDEIPRNLGNTSAGGPGLFNAGYYVIGKQSAQEIGFIPIPTEAGADAISIWGIVLPSDMSSASDSVDIPYADRFAYLIELYAAAILLRKGQQEEAAAQRYIQEYQAGITQMKTFLKERQSDGVVTIQDVLYEDIAMDNPL